MSIPHHAPSQGLALTGRQGGELVLHRHKRCYSEKVTLGGNGISSEGETVPRAKPVSGVSVRVINTKILAGC